MSKKVISGTISGGYVLTSAYAELSITSTGVIDGAAGGVALTSLYGASLANSGTIAGGAGAYGYGFGTAGGAGASLAEGGTVTNKGMIIGGAGGDSYLFGGWGGAGVSLTDGGRVDNFRSIIGGAGGGSTSEYGGDGGAGILLAVGGTVDNSGSIRGGAGGPSPQNLRDYYRGGLGGAGVSLEAVGTVDNSGLIAGGRGGDGRPDGGGGNGVSMQDGGSVYNKGRIVGAKNDTGVYGGSGVHADDKATLTNLGTIVGYGEYKNSAAIVFEGGGILFNGAGALAQGYDGFSGGGTIINYGIIEGRNYAGLNLDSNHDSVTNHMGGLIKGQKWGVVVHDTTVINFGTIEGTEGALRLSGGYSRLVSETGAIFIGQVQAGGGTLELAAQTETITGLGATGTISGDVAMTFSGFGTYQLDAGGRFILQGTNALASGQTLEIEGRTTSAGTLTIDGSVSGAGALAAIAGTVNIGTSLTFGGAFTESARATVVVAAGDTLTLLAPAVLDGTVNGSVSIRDANVAGLTIGGVGLLTASGTVSQTGAVTIGGTNSDAAILSVLKSGAWEIGSGSIASGVGGGRLRVFGQLIKTAGAGMSTVGVTTLDYGTVQVVAGKLDFTRPLFGTGGLQIDAGATLEADAAAVSTLTAAFDGPDATLALKFPNAFQATIAGLAAGDLIDLLAKTATGAGVNANDQLVIVDGATTVATLQLSGAYMGATFTATSDGAGGTDIELVSPRGAGLPSIPRMVQAMATMGAPAGVANRGHDLISVRTLDLARPHIQMQ